MSQSFSSSRINRLSALGFFILIYISSTSCSLKSDNAVTFAYTLEKAVNSLITKDIGSEYEINFKPMDTETPFTILIFSDKGVTFDELIEKGLDSLLVEDLFPQLSYIDLKNRATSVVYQNGKISYTTYYRRFADVRTMQVINGKGNTDIMVKSIGRGPGNLTDEVLLVELY